MMKPPIPNGKPQLKTLHWLLLNPHQHTPMSADSCAELAFESPQVLLPPQIADAPAAVRADLRPGSFNCCGKLALIKQADRFAPVLEVLDHNKAFIRELDHSGGLAQRVLIDAN